MIPLTQTADSQGILRGAHRPNRSEGRLAQREIFSRKRFGVEGETNPEKRIFVWRGVPRRVSLESEPSGARHLYLADRILEEYPPE